MRSQLLLLTLKRLWRRPTRTVLTVLGIAAAIGTLATLAGFYRGYRSGLERELAGLGYEALITRRGCPYEIATFALQGRDALGAGVTTTSCVAEAAGNGSRDLEEPGIYIPASIKDLVAQDPEVAIATPLLTCPVEESGGQRRFFLFQGVDLDSYRRIKPGITLAAGDWLSPADRPQDVIVKADGERLSGLIIHEDDETVTLQQIELREFQGDEIAALLNPELKGVLGTREITHYRRDIEDIERAGLPTEPSVLAGADIAEQLDLEPGRTLDLTGIGRFRIAGILGRTGSTDDGHFLMDLPIAQRFFLAFGRLTGIGVKLNDPRQLPAFRDRAAKLPGVQVVSLSEVRGGLENLLATAEVLMLSLAVLATIVAGFGIVNTVLTAVRERSREIGILKALGARDGSVFGLVQLETALLCLIGSALGLLGALCFGSLASTLMKDLLPYAPTGALVVIGIDLVALAVGGALVLGFLAGLYPAWRAARLDPARVIGVE
ncbi:MAG: FtsX-like permease family protein [Planctomycetota bacterium]